MLRETIFQPLKYHFNCSSTLIQTNKFSLFNSPAFLARHGKQVKQFLLNRNSEIVGIIHFTFSGESALSPQSASFGGFEFAPDVPERIVSDFATWVFNAVASEGVKEILITMSPQFYTNTRQDIIEKTLKDCQFEVLHETGQVIRNCQHDFQTHLTRFEKKKMDRCLRESFKASKGKGAFPMEAYEVIEKHRKLKHLPVSVSFEELQNNTRKFSDYFNWFTVAKENKTIAASLGIHVKEDVLYHFFPGHDPSFDNYSPMVLLVNEVYNYCLRKNIKHFDLGISSINGEINPGLFQFKKNLGAKSYKQAKLKWTAPKR